MPWVSGRGGSVRGDCWIFRGPGFPGVHLRVSLIGGAVDLPENSSRPFSAVASACPATHGHLIHR